MLATAPATYVSCMSVRKGLELAWL